MRWAWKYAINKNSFSLKNFLRQDFNKLLFNPLPTNILIQKSLKVKKKSIIPLGAVPLSQHHHQCSEVSGVSWSLACL